MDLREILNRPPKRQRLDEEGDTHAQRSPSHHAPSWGHNHSVPATTSIHPQRHCNIFSNSASTKPNATPIHAPLRTGSHCNNDRGNYYSQAGYAGHLATDVPSQNDQPSQWHRSEVPTMSVNDTWPSQSSIPPAPIVPLQAHTPSHASYYEQSLVPQALPNQSHLGLQWPESHEREALSPFIPGGSAPPRLLADEFPGTVEAQDITVCFGMVSSTRSSCGRSSTKIPDFGHLGSV